MRSAQQIIVQEKYDLPSYFKFLSFLRIWVFQLLSETPLRTKLLKKSENSLRHCLKILSLIIINFSSKILTKFVSPKIR